MIRVGCAVALIQSNKPRFGGVVFLQGRNMIVSWFDIFILLSGASAASGVIIAFIAISLFKVRGWRHFLAAWIVGAVISCLILIVLFQIR